MSRRVRLPSFALLRVITTLCLLLACVAAVSAMPLPASAQDGGDPTPMDQPPIILELPGPVEPVLPVEPAAWDGPVETLDYVEPAVPMDVSSETAVSAGKTTQLRTNADTFITSGDPSDNFGGASTMQLGWPNDQFKASRILIRFDTNPIPNKAKIYSAKLHIYLDSALPATPPTIMHINGASATRGWDEGGATWNNARDIASGQWHLGDVNTQPGWKSFGLTSQVQQWVNGQSNNGMVIIGYEVAPNGRIFRSRHYGGSEPYLEVSYECDTLPPVTTVNKLPAESTGSFTVTWGGSDQAPKNCTPTGIRKFAVQYRIDGSSWQDWKSTTATSATFDNLAPNGARVDFRVYADDNAGNVENKPSSPQAATRVVSQAPVVSMTPLPEITHAASFVISWTPTSAPIGIAGYDVQWQINGGGWADLLAGTTQTSYTISGAQSEHVYAFRVRGRDKLGNVGAFPAAPQARTTVVLYPIAKMVPLNPNLINSSSPVTTSFPIYWTGNTAPGTTITQYQVHYQVRSMTGVLLQPWTIWQTFDGATTGVTFPIALGDAIYQFEATATNNLGQTTPFASKAEATMIVDTADSIKPRNYLPEVLHR